MSNSEFLKSEKPEAKYPTRIKDDTRVAGISPQKCIGKSGFQMEFTGVTIISNASLPDNFNLFNLPLLHHFGWDLYL
jgi:hypothetical protein